MDMRRRIPSQRSEEWAIRAARNAVEVLSYLVEPGEDTPEISIEEVSSRIRKRFPDRQAWNKIIHESELAPEEKLWLILP